MICKYCKKREGQVLPVFGPQNICYHCGAKMCKDIFNSPNPIYKKLQQLKKKVKK